MTNILGQLESSEFLDRHWQKHPLLVRNAFSNLEPLLDPDTLAGLSLEESVRSRIVTQFPDEQRWVCTYGPFTEDDFSALPSTHWTLLVQDVEKHLPEHAAVMQYFSFLPRWRIDDLMVSYAVDGGSVGPHIDQYDVFLLQVRGQRKWQLQTDNIRENDLLEDSELRILRDFQIDQEWVLNPGDLLYLPPGVPHFGVAIGECMTYSIGFRAPMVTDILQAVTDQYLQSDSKPLRFTDSIDIADFHHGELTQTDLAHMRTIVQSSLNQNETVTQAIGALLTEPVDTPSLCIDDSITLENFSKQLPGCNSLVLHPAARCLYVQQAEGITWFINTRMLDIDRSLAPAIMKLCDDYKLQNRMIRQILEEETLTTLFYDLYHEGYLQLGYQDT